MGESWKKKGTVSDVGILCVCIRAMHVLSAFLMLIRLPGHEIFDESMCAQSVSLDDLNLSFIFSCDAIFYVDGIHLKVHHSSEKLGSMNAVGSSDCQKSKPICWATLSIIQLP